MSESSRRSSVWWPKRVLNYWSTSASNLETESAQTSSSTESSMQSNSDLSQKSVENKSQSETSLNVIISGVNSSESPDIYSNKYINLFMKRIRKRLKMDAKECSERQYWMPDSNAKECYECGEKYTVLRRRHHCRICGQIFCTKCCNEEIDGKLIGQSSRGYVRACNYCHKIVMSYITDRNTDTNRDSEFKQFREILISKSIGDSFGDQIDSTFHSRSDEHLLTNNLMVSQSSNSCASHSAAFKRRSSVGFREEDYAKAKNRVLDIDNEVNQLGSSSQSPIHTLSSFNIYKTPIKTGNSSVSDLLPLRTDEVSHEPLWVKEINEEVEELQSFEKLDLESSSEVDNSSTNESNIPTPISVSSAKRLAYSPSTYDIELDFEKDRVSISKTRKNTENPEKEIQIKASDEGLNNEEFVVTTTSSNWESLKDGTQEKVAYDALNTAYNQLYTKLLTQLLEDEGLSLSWLNVIQKITAKVSAVVRPNSHNDIEEMDVRNYVKIKTIPNGVKSDCHIINGVVFSKNIAHRKMRQIITHPRILLLSCPIVYQRTEKKFTALDPVLLQENEYIKNLIAKICSYKPDLILVERTVTRIAQELLLSNDITLICNVKPIIIERISRFTGAAIVSSLDAQIGVPQLGICQKFFLQTFNQKTLMYFDGCPQHMGCTVLIRGGSLEELKKIKSICSFMVFCDFNWQLERSFLMDEYCFPSELHESQSEKSIDSNSLSESFNSRNSSQKEKSIGSTIIDDNSDPLCSMATDLNLKEVSSPIDVCISEPNHTREEDFIDLNRKMSHFLSELQLSCSPFITIPLPYLMTTEGNKSKLRKYFNSKLVWSKRLESDSSKSNELKVENAINFRNREESSTELVPVKKHPFLTRDLKSPANSHEIKSLVADFRAKGPFLENTQKLVKDSNVKSEDDLVNKNNEMKQTLQIDALNPIYHQHLPVLFSSFSYASTNAPNYCVKPWIVNMDFYGCNDIPLGGFLERYCFSSTYSCPSSTCSTPMIEHVRRFVHSNGCILIVLRQLKQNVEAAQSSIITWSWCQKCKTGTPYSNLSSDTWSLSFAKYLELKFYGCSYKRRATLSSVSCFEHSLHTDHFQFFAYKQVVASFKYLPVILHEIALSEHCLLPYNENSAVIVKDDDPGSIIAYALNSNDYEKQLAELSRMSSSPNVKRKGTSSTEPENFSDSLVSKPSSNSLSQHIDLQYSDTTTKFYCCVYYAEQFRKFRSNIFDCSNGEELYIRSLTNCVPWKARGGKSGSTFCKTLNDRFILKEMSKLELQSFLNIANYYFDYCTSAISESRPTLLAKIVGVYRTSYKNSATNKASKLYLLVMENLFYNYNISQKFDLKGSIRNRLVDTNSQDLNADQIVLLDENLLKMTCDCPLYIQSHSKTILRAAIDNDSLFLSSHSVMDYSLLVGIDDEHNEFVVGIIDYIRPFTWDKKIESVVKSVGSQGKLPTIVQPDLYRIRFCEAMDQYFLCVPDKWFSIINFN